MQKTILQNKNNKVDITLERLIIICEMLHLSIEDLLPSEVQDNIVKEKLIREIAYSMRDMDAHQIRRIKRIIDVGNKLSRYLNIFR